MGGHGLKLFRRMPMPWLILGDVLTVLIVSLAGFLTHYGEIRGWRWVTTFVPVLAGWLAIAPWFGVYRPEFTGRITQIWRAALAAFLSAPLAAWLRGAWLGSAILPVFVLVMGLTDALGILIWRAAAVWIAKRVGRNG